MGVYPCPESYLMSRRFRGLYEGPSKGRGVDRGIQG